MPISKINGIVIGNIKKISGDRRQIIHNLSTVHLFSYVVASGSVTLANTYLDLSKNNAFAFLDGVDLSDYQDGNYDLVIFDSAGKQIRGRIKAEAPSGEALGAEILLNPGCESTEPAYWAGNGYAADPRTGSGGSTSFYGDGTQPKVYEGCDFDLDFVDEIMYNKAGKLYYYDRVTGETKINDVPMEDMQRVNNKMYIDFGAAWGVYYYTGGSYSVNLTAETPSLCVNSDCDLDGLDEFNGCFSVSNGVWVYDESSGWTRWTTEIPTDIFRDDHRFYGYFAAYPSWWYYTNGVWTQVLPLGTGTVTDKRRWVAYQQIIVENGHCYKYGGWMKADTAQNAGIYIQPFYYYNGLIYPEIDYGATPISSITTTSDSWTEAYSKFTASQLDYLFLLKEDIEPKTAKILIDDVTVKQITEVDAEGVHIVSNAEDFTDYTEVDTDGYLTVTANTITATNLPTRGRTAYVYRDLGADFLTGDFRIDFEFQQTTWLGSNWYILPFWWMVANDIGDGYALAAASKDFLGLFGYCDSGSGLRLWFWENIGGVQHLSTGTYYYTLKKRYYISICRVSTAGANGTVYVNVYSDVGKSILLGTIQHPLSHANPNFRYLYGMNEYDDNAYGPGTCEVSGTVDNMRVVSPAINDLNMRAWNIEEPGFNRNDSSGYTYQVRRI